MGFPFALILQAPAIIGAIAKALDLVEDLVRKPKAGAEKKEMVLDKILGDISDDAYKLEDTEYEEDTYIPTKMLFFDGKYNWGCLLSELPELRAALGDVIDAVVSVKNILTKCDE